MTFWRDLWLRLVALPPSGSTRQDYWHLEQQDAEARRDELRKRLLRAEADIVRRSHGEEQ